MEKSNQRREDCRARKLEREKTFSGFKYITLIVSIENKYQKICDQYEESTFKDTQGAL